MPNQDFKREFDTKFITSDENPKAMIEFCEAFGRKLSHEITTSQIRKPYGQVKKIQSQIQTQKELTPLDYRKILLLKPQLAYAKARAKNLAELENVLSQAIDAINEDRDNFQRFCNFFEAILAYHKAAGGN